MRSFVNPQRSSRTSGSAPEWQTGSVRPVQHKSGSGRPAARRAPPTPGVQFDFGRLAIDREPPGGEAEQIHQAARRGTSGSGAKLPHFERIQQSFGHHDISSIGAFLGPSATAANQEMGAAAFASGESVAFAETPSLHTAAHEAAHVVQQRQGLSLPGGVGKAGDSHERHADEVANRVVAGQSSQGLLDAHGGPTRAPSGGASQVQGTQVQRLEPEELGDSTSGNVPHPTEDIAYFDIRDYTIDGEPYREIKLFNRHGEETGMITVRSHKVGEHSYEKTTTYTGSAEPGLFEAIDSWIGEHKISSLNAIAGAAASSPIRMRLSLRRDIETKKYFLELYVGMAAKASNTEDLAKGKALFGMVKPAMKNLFDNLVLSGKPDTILPSLTFGIFLNLGKGRMARLLPSAITTPMFQFQVNAGGFVVNAMCDIDFLRDNWDVFERFARTGTLDRDKLVGKIGFSAGKTTKKGVGWDFSVFDEVRVLQLGKDTPRETAEAAVTPLAKMILEAQRIILNIASPGIGDRLAR